MSNIRGEGFRESGWQSLAAVLGVEGETCPIRLATLVLTVDPDALVDLPDEVIAAAESFRPHFLHWYSRDQLIDLSGNLELIREQVAIFRYDFLTEDMKVLAALITIQQLLWENPELNKLHA